MEKLKETEEKDVMEAALERDVENLLKKIEACIEENNPTQLTATLNQCQGHLTQKSIRRPFLKCVKKGLHSCAEAFIDADLQPSLNLLQDEEGRFPLMVAAERNDVKMVQLLTKRPFNTGAVRHKMNGKTPLHTAVEQDNLEMVQTLVAAGFDVNAEYVVPHQKMYPLGMAMLRRDQEDTVWLLVENGADCDRQYSCCTMPCPCIYMPDAGNHGDPQTPTRCAWTVLIWALYYAGDEFLDAILGRVRDVDVPDDKGQTALFHAVCRHDVRQVRKLLLRGADPNAERVEDTCVNFEAYPLDQWSYLTCDGNTPFQVAVETDLVGIAKELIELGGVDVNASYKGFDEFTENIPVVQAAIYGYTQMMRLLLASGAGAAHIDDHGYDIAHHIFSPRVGDYPTRYDPKSDRRVLDVLLQSGLNLDHRYPNRLSLFLQFIRWQDFELVAKCIEWGVDPEEHSLEKGNSEIFHIEERLYENNRCSALSFALSGIPRYVIDHMETPWSLDNIDKVEQLWKIPMLLMQAGSAVRSVQVTMINAVHFFLRERLGTRGCPTDVPQILLDTVIKVSCNPRSLRELCIFSVRKCLKYRIKSCSHKLSLPEEVVNDLSLGYLPVFHDCND